MPQEVQRRTAPNVMPQCRPDMQNPISFGFVDVRSSTTGRPVSWLPLPPTSVRSRMPEPGGQLEDDANNLGEERLTTTLLRFLIAYKTRTGQHLQQREGKHNSRIQNEVFHGWHTRHNLVSHVNDHQ